MGLATRGIYITYQVKADSLVRAIALTKLEFILLPILEEVRRLSPTNVKLVEEVLSYGLFSCATLSRDFTGRPDAFFLNLALGVRLATSPSIVLSKAFGWHNVPRRAAIQRSLVPVTQMVEELLKTDNG